MYHEGTTPIPPRAREALERVEAAAGGKGPEDGIPRQEAVEVLLGAGFDDAEVEDVIETLLDRGYLYQVGDQIRVTPEV